MHSGSQTNALAETALALSMAFFSIMVLTLVSMGAGRTGFNSPTPAAPDEVNLISSAARQAPPSSTVRTATPSLDDLVLFFDGRFYDGELSEIPPAMVAGPRGYVLAVDPGLSISDATAARARLAAENVTVTTITDPWMSRLKELRK